MFHVEHSLANAIPRKEALNMAKGSVGRSDYLSSLRFDVLQTAASTYIEDEIDTNLSAERGVMMEIHSIDCYFENMDHMVEVAVNNEEHVEMHVARKSKSAIARYSDSDVIAKLGFMVGRSAAIGTDAGPLFYHTPLGFTVYFPVPIPYVKPSIFVGLNASDATEAHRITGRINYTLREIDRARFLELLVALQ